MIKQDILILFRHESCVLCSVFSLFSPLGNVKKLKRKYIERMRQKCPNSLKSVESRSTAELQKVGENKVNNRGNGVQYKSGNLGPDDSKAGPSFLNITLEHLECFLLWILTIA